MLIKRVKFIVQLLNFLKPSAITSELKSHPSEWQIVEWTQIRLVSFDANVVVLILLNLEICFIRTCFLNHLES